MYALGLFLHIPVDLSYSQIPDNCNFVAYTCFKSQKNCYTWEK